MIICYFGIYNPDYSRNRVLINGLKQNGIKIIECNSRKKGLAKYFDLIRKHRVIKEKYNLMIIGFPGYQAMILAYFLSRSPIVFDSFSSLYDSMVFDRQVVKLRSFKANYYWFLDWLSCGLADKIIVDTKAHIDYYAKEFGVKKEKFIRIFVGADERIMKPILREKNNDYFLVHFHGSCIPLQGVKYILEVAKILEKENVRFNIIGSKIKNAHANRSLSNINFIEDVPYEELPFFMAKADVCLGIFGKTNKAQRVIPNKVFEALAVGKAVLTEKSEAAKELLTDRTDALFCQLADSKDLANKIMELKNNNDLREKIAQNGYKLFSDKLTSPKLAADLINNLKLKSFVN